MSVSYTHLDVYKRQMEHTHKNAAPEALPGLWREEGGLAGLVRLDVPATTPGMVVVAKQGEPWREQPELLSLIHI